MNRRVPLRRQHTKPENEFKREKPTISDREKEIEILHELQRKCERKEDQISLKYKAEKEKGLQKLSKIREERMKLFSKKDNNQEDTFINHNERARRKKWDKNIDYTDITIVGTQR